MVLVVGVTVDWAFAEKVANAMRTTRQNKTAADCPRTPDLFCATDTAVIEGLTFGLPCLDNFGCRDLSLTLRRRHPFACAIAAARNRIRKCRAIILRNKPCNCME
jgi:hypothetical protein